MFRYKIAVVVAAGTIACPAAPALSETPLPEAIAAPGETEIARFHAEGAQVYGCKPGADGKLVWMFREPVATLISNGKTAGRHYAGPVWELADGSAVAGKVVGRSPGLSPKDIPWLKLNVTSSTGKGQLSGATTIQRIDTTGGIAEGTCGRQGEFLSVAYSAEYRFLKKN